MHVAYRYISYSSEAEQGKWWTFVEATTQKSNYLPYVTNNDADKFYQSFLFNGCVYPSFSWTTISYREELCTVETNDNKSYTIQAIDEKYRSDGTKVTLNDIYFTYNTLLKDNYRNIGALDGFNNVSIVANEDDETMQVTFPNASVDNMIFFTNFILPAHILANQSLETYVSTFYTAPIGTNCGSLAETKNDEDSIVFDLSNCTDVPLKFYQVKQFDGQTALDAYVASKNNTIDLIIWNEWYVWYESNKVILNTFDTIFFNTKSPLLWLETRKALATTIISYLDTTNILDPYIIKDQYLFDALPTIPESTSLDTLLQQDTKSEISIPIEKIAVLPQIIRWDTNAPQEQEYIIETAIEDKQSMKFLFDSSFDKISVSFNEGIEYFPESYDPNEQSSYYNLTPTYRNIVEWRNTYTIKWYVDNIHTQTYTLVVYYLSEPSYPKEEVLISDTDDYQPISIIYFNDPTSNAIAGALKEFFTTSDLLDYFIFRSYDDPDVFAGKIQSTDYDIVISSIAMWLRKDISNLFLTDNPTINPSLYTDTNLAAAVNERFLFPQAAKPAIKERISNDYSSAMPFVILGKELGNIHIKDTLSFPYPLRMYVLWRRKDFIKDLPIFQHFRINRDRVWTRSNFENFLRNSWSIHN